MKKAIFSLLTVFLLVSTVAFCQIYEPVIMAGMTNTEIAQVIEMSKELNKKAGVNDPNLIFPGQTLTFRFWDNSLWKIDVNKGDCEYKMLRYRLPELISIHGPVVNYSDTTNVADSIPIPVADARNGWIDFYNAWKWFPWYAWLAILVAVFSLGWLVFKKKENPSEEFKHSDDPTKEGKPFVEEGVALPDAEQHFQTLIGERNPGSTVSVRNIKPGFLSTPNGLPAVVEFADGTTQNLTFRNTPGYEGEVSINDGPYTKEYFFQGCGNPAYNRTSMNGGGIIFSTEPIIFGDETPEAELASSESAEIKVSTEKLENKVVDEPLLDEGSELYKMAGEHALMVDEFLKSQTAHKVTMKFTNEQGSLETIFETKNFVARKKSTEKPNQK